MEICMELLLGNPGAWFLTFVKPKIGEIAQSFRRKGCSYNNIRQI